MSGKLNNCIFPSSIRTIILLLAAVLFQPACSTTAPPPQRSLYYWKSVFHLTNPEKQFLQDANITALYVKYFDVDLVAESGNPVPVATLQEAPGSMRNLSGSISIIPVIFITQPALRKMPDSSLSRYAAEIATRIRKMNAAYSVVTKEWQIDCDWTASTSHKYFTLLRHLRDIMHREQLKLSITLRLYPYKYRERMGIPPADRAMLMCYNMGNLTNPATMNSILDPLELKKYVGTALQYPIQLDAALPLFSWFVWFRGMQYRGLVYPSDIQKAGWTVKDRRITINNDTVMNGRQFLAGDWLRQEETTMISLKKARGLINTAMTGQYVSRLALFHLDSLILSKYNPDALEDLFDGRR